jgi:hypothetical protein
VITNAELRAAYLDDRMFGYFVRKFSDVPREELLARIEEALKFLFICEQCDGSIPVTQEIDDIWHAWILQTQEYLVLCSRLPTGEFIHHSSNDYLVSIDPQVNERDNLACDVRMLAAYVAHFGGFADDRVQHWKLATSLVTDLGWTVEQLNDWLGGSDVESRSAVSLTG